MAASSSTDIRIKICGVRTPEIIVAAADAGADAVGFVFFPPSPRHLSLGAARELRATVPPDVAVVALTVDADDAALEAIMTAARPDVLQLHGEESPERLEAIAARFGLPLVKAVPLELPADLAAAGPYAHVAGQLLFDAKAPKETAGSGSAALPGGNGRSFDWAMLTGFDAGVPWILGGGLTPDTVAAAIRVSGARGVDVSSGVERTRGEKDPDLVRTFVARAREALGQVTE